MDRTIKEYFGDDRYDRYVLGARKSLMFGILLSDLEKDDLYAVIGFLSKNYELIKWRDGDGNP